ncbi:hypothetical protein V6N12_013195 [Hibiscus sabdariffa]|uniref:Retrotransposon gag domain-containing protein n=1 Tax=Hibiscus sabdariffa TaxID=183260 RepID=A0ABR2D5T0_9ROSI
MTTNKERIENLEASFSTVQNSLNNGNNHNGQSYVGRFQDNSSPGHQFVSSRLAKLGFPKFTGEADQWWQWLLCTFKDEGKEVTWLIFEKELWARFGPTDCEDFDETLSRVRQLGRLIISLVKNLATWLQLPVIPTEPFTVKVANEAPLKCQGRYDTQQGSSEYGTVAARH